VINYLLRKPVTILKQKLIREQNCDTAYEESEAILQAYKSHPPNSAIWKVEQFSIVAIIGNCITDSMKKFCRVNNQKEQ
jgi:hypothetical protein